jgi:Ca2+-transporting ATPase
MADPLRDEALNAIATCRDAGMRVIMITGDQVATASEIGRRLDIMLDREGRPFKAIHGRDLMSLSDDGWQQVVSDASVFARVSPEHKLRIVEALQRRGEIVAMTGDGVNDAPALRKADIGIAMGIKGTQVAKDASDMVIADDNFATIVYAVEQGRIIYANIIRFVHYLFSCNLSEILTVFIAIMLGWPLPLSAIQILWLNMITDVFPALALVLEPSSPDMMKRPPRDPKESLMSPYLVWLVSWQAAVICAVTLTAFGFGMARYGTDASGLRHAGTLCFMTLALSQIFHAFSARSQKRSAASIFTSTNWWLWAAVILSIALQLIAVYLSPLNSLLHTVPMQGWDWTITLSLALAPVVVVETVKSFQRLRPFTL